MAIFKHLIYALLDIISINSILYPQSLTILLTVRTDLFNKSNKIIKFKGRNNFLGFTVDKACDEKTRRALAWFYRNHDSPNITEWKNFFKKFKFETFPHHKLCMWSINDTRSNVYIYIHSINDKYIHYTIENNEIKNESIYIPIGYGTLLPERYVYNYELFKNHILNTI
jgi:hypothetical protein